MTADRLTTARAALFQADLALTAALHAQYPHLTHLGDVRYDSDRDNPATAAARAVYHDASDSYVFAMRDQEQGKFRDMLTGKSAEAARKP